MSNTIVGAGAVGAEAASRYGSGSDQKMRLLAAQAPQHCSARMCVSGVLIFHSIKSQIPLLCKIENFKNIFILENVCSA
jgi:hypothetical protein